MPEYLSKEAKRLAQTNFKEKKPMLIDSSPITKRWMQYWTVLGRDNLKLILDDPDFDYMSSDEEHINVHFKRLETTEECQSRIRKLQAEWDAYELRKKAFYADIQKRIYEAEEAEKLRRERFNNPEYIEFLRLKKKFGEM